MIEFRTLRSSGIVGGRELSPPSHAESFFAVEAASGSSLPGHFFDASAAQIDEAASAAGAAFESLGSVSAGTLSRLLATIAANVRDQRVAILERCGEETGYLPARVEGEFHRAAGQLELFSGLARDRVWDDRQIDPADPTRPGLPKPELRRRKVPLGPVAVFGACNFPLAISVVGNDTVAALAVGCPVVVKSHPGHPGTCHLLARCAADAVTSLDLPPGMFSLLHGRQPETSVSLVTHPAVAAVGFTGSPTGGRALAEAALRRERPIPVFAELGSTNPVFLAPAAAAGRTSEIAQGFVASVRFGNGQMCTKPGVLVMLDDHADGMVEAVRHELARHEPLPMLNGNVAAGFDEGVRRLAETPGTERLPARANPRNPGGFTREFEWFSVSGPAALASDLLHSETFGPVSLLVRCGDVDEMLAVARAFHGSLTTTLHAAVGEFRGDEGFLDRWLPIAERFAGRIVLNGWPTGMEIGSATHHGGPYPASLDGRSTSVGHASLERFIRPVCYQNWDFRP